MKGLEEEKRSGQESPGCEKKAECFLMFWKYTGCYIDNGNQLFFICIEGKPKENGLNQRNDKFKLLRPIVELVRIT